MSPEMQSALINAFYETLLMVFASGAIAIIVGIPLGVILFGTRPGQLLEAPWLNRGIILIVNALRSLPFIILLVALIPLTRLLVGTSIGTVAAIVPLSIGAIPFVGRLTDSALQEVPQGLIEMGLALGSSRLQVITRILLPESLPGLINGITLTLITLIGYSAMAGAIGAGGLGDLAIRYGYERFDVEIMLITIVLLLLMVQLLQFAGDRLVCYFTH